MKQQSFSCNSPTVLQSLLYGLASRGGMGKGIIMLSVYLRLRAEPHEILRMMFIVKFQYFYANFVRLEVIIKNAPVLQCFNRCNKSFSQPKCFVTRHPKGSNPALFVDQVL